MKIKDIRKLNPEDLEKKLSEIGQELSILKGQSATGTPPKNPGKIKLLRKTIARIKTIQTEREIEEFKKKFERSKKVNA